MITLENTSTLEKLVKQALPLWGISEPVELKLLSYSENATYLIKNEVNQWVMRIHRKGYHTIDGVRSEIAWMQALREDMELETPQALEGLNGEFLQLIPDSDESEPRMIVLFEFVEGKEPDATDLVVAAEQLGFITAQLHKHAKQWELPNYFQRQHWDLEGAFGQNPNWGHWLAGFDQNTQGLEIVQKAELKMHERLNTFGKSKNKYGLIHSDFRSANLLIHEGSTKILDFDDCGFGWYLYDLGSSLTFLENHENIQEIIKSWLNGYFMISNLTEEEFNQIPTFMMLRRLILMGWAGSHPTTELARTMASEGYTKGTVEFAEKYLNDQVLNKISYHQFLKGA